MTNRLRISFASYHPNSTVSPDLATLIAAERDLRARVNAAPETDTATLHDWQGVLAAAEDFTPRNAADIAAQITLANEAYEGSDHAATTLARVLSELQRLAA